MQLCGPSFAAKLARRTVITGRLPVWCTYSKRRSYKGFTKWICQIIIQKKAPRIKNTNLYRQTILICLIKMNMKSLMALKTLTNATCLTRIWKKCHFSSQEILMSQEILARMTWGQLLQIMVINHHQENRMNLINIRLKRAHSPSRATRRQLCLWN